MKDKKNLYLIFKDKQSNVIFEGIWYKIPIKDTYIIDKCIEFYGDPEPCFIHRSAALSRIYNEILTLCDLFLFKETGILDLDNDFLYEIKKYVEHIDIIECKYIEVIQMKG